MAKASSSSSGGGGEATAKKQPGEKAAGKKLQVTDFVISGAKVHANTLLSGGKTVTLILPDIHLSNLGTGPDGITAGDLTKTVLSQLTTETLTALTKEAANLGKGALDVGKGATGEAQKDVNKITGGLKSLLGK